MSSTVLQCVFLDTFNTLSLSIFELLYALNFATSSVLSFNVFLCYKLCYFLMSILFFAIITKAKKSIPTPRYFCQIPTGIFVKYLTRYFCQNPTETYRTLNYHHRDSANILLIAMFTFLLKQVVASGDVSINDNDATRMKMISH